MGVAASVVCVMNLSNVSAAIVAPVIVKGTVVRATFRVERIVLVPVIPTVWLLEIAATGYVQAALRLGIAVRRIVKTSSVAMTVVAAVVVAVPPDLHVKQVNAPPAPLIVLARNVATTNVTVVVAPASRDLFAKKTNVYRVFPSAMAWFVVRMDVVVAVVNAEPMRYANLVDVMSVSATALAKTVARTAVAVPVAPARKANIASAVNASVIPKPVKVSARWDAVTGVLRIGVQVVTYNRKTARWKAMYVDGTRNTVITAAYPFRVPIRWGSFLTHVLFANRNVV